MDRIGNRSFEDFPATTLFLDDVRDIIEVFEDTCQRFEVKANEYKITSASELGDLAAKFPGGRLDDIYIQGYDPYVSVDLRSFRVRAYVSDDTPVQMGVVAKVREIVDRGKRWTATPVLYVPGWILSMLGVGLLVWDRPALGVSAMSFAASATALSWLMLKRQSVIVYAIERGTRSGFFKRKRDEVVLALIAAAAGSLITYVTTKLLP